MRLNTSGYGSYFVTLVIILRITSSAERLRFLLASMTEARKSETCHRRQHCVLQILPVSQMHRSALLIVKIVLCDASKKPSRPAQFSPVS